MQFNQSADFLDRRTALASKIRKRHPGAALLMFSAPEHIRNQDVEHEYRQNSDFYYLTGFTEPQSAFFFDVEEEKLILFVRPKDPERAIWDGPRAGVEGAVSHFGAVEAYPIAELPSKLSSFLENKHVVYTNFGEQDANDALFWKTISTLKTKTRFGKSYPSEFVDLAHVLSEERLIKQASEIPLIQKACDITGLAHRKAMALTRPGMREYEIEALLLETFRKHGSERVAYSSIVGSGPNATILHYRAGGRELKEGELVLIDAGCEYGYYASDVTRVYPVAGVFSPEQKALYELVLNSQVEAISASVCGQTLEGIHKGVVEHLTKGLIDLGLLKGDLSELIQTEKYKRFYMHRTSHFLGMDVHDVGTYSVGGKPRVLEDGMLITVEPGLYISPEDDTVDAKWRGIGIRIEDDILICKNGPKNLTESIPKTVLEIEYACKSGFSS